MFSDIENNVWSNKFALKNNKLVNRFLNKSYITCIDLKTLSYKTDAESLVDLLKDPVHSEYQSKLLSKYFNKPKQYLKLDCDYLSIQVDCSKSNTLDLLTDKVDGLVRCRNKALNKILSIKHESDVGKANNGLKKKKTSLFTSVYKIRLFNDRRKFMHIYIADGTVGKKGHKRVQIDFIPSRFTSDETSILFGHIKSILKNRVYKQFISKARYKRVDVAFNMPGVFQPFVFPAHYDIDNVSVGSCWPKDGLVETTYLG
jgi:hypothetical protein